MRKESARMGQVKELNAWGSRPITRLFALSKYLA